MICDLRNVTNVIEVLIAPNRARLVEQFHGETLSAFPLHCPDRAEMKSLTVLLTNVDADVISATR